MDDVYKMVLACAIAVIMILTLKHRSSELAALVSLAACAVVFAMGSTSIRTVLAWFREMGSENGVQSSLMATVLKVCGIGVLSQGASLFCRDAGENSLGKVVELCAGAMAACAMLPLMDSAMDTANRLLGG